MYISDMRHVRVHTNVTILHDCNGGLQLGRRTAHQGFRSQRNAAACVDNVHKEVHQGCCELEGASCAQMIVPLLRYLQPRGLSSGNFSGLFFFVPTLLSS